MAGGCRGCPEEFDPPRSLANTTEIRLPTGLRSSDLEFSGLTWVTLDQDYLLLLWEKFESVYLIPKFERIIHRRDSATYVAAVFLGGPTDAASHEHRSNRSNT